jgi:hypothetical protein
MLRSNQLLRSACRLWDHSRLFKFVVGTSLNTDDRT